MLLCWHLSLIILLQNNSSPPPLIKIDKLTLYHDKNKQALVKVCTLLQKKSIIKNNVKIGNAILSPTPEGQFNP